MLEVGERTLVFCEFGEVILEPVPVDFLAEAADDSIDHHYAHRFHGVPLEQHATVANDCVGYERSRPRSCRDFRAGGGVFAW